MSDPRDPEERPRPQYGEYASPEEQQARIRQPDVTDELDRGRAPVVPADAAGADAGSAPASAPTAGTAIDRIATAVLLGLGAVNVLFTVPGFLDLSATFARTMEAMGIPGSFTNDAAAQTWGSIAVVVLIAGFLITALASWRRLRAGRRAWWIPLVGAAVTYVIVVSCLTVPIAGDPAFQEYVATLS